VRGSLRLVRLRALLERTLVSFRGEPLIVHGDLSPEAALAVIDERLSGRWFPGRSKGDGFVYGYASAKSIAAWAKRPNVRSMGTQVFKGRVVGEGVGCVLVGSMRSFAFVRAFLGLWIGFACLGAAAMWGSVVWHAIGGGFTPSMIGFALAATGFPLFGFCLYALGVAISASDALFLKEWLLNCVNTEAPDGRYGQT